MTSDEIKVPQPEARFLPFEGSVNFRDFGGYVTRDGRRVRWRRLYRCGALGYLSGPDHERFSELGIGVICDLRRHEEAERVPTPSHAPFDCRQHIPIAPGSNAMLWESLNNDTHVVHDRVQTMTSITREIARDHMGAYQRLFAYLIETDDAFLLHCSAGKDRTGFGVALILSALGVDEDTILKDYLLTNEAECLFRLMGGRLRQNHRVIDDESLRAVVGVRAEYLLAAFDEVNTRHGSIDNYLKAIGVDQTARRKLQDRLLEA